MFHTIFQLCIFIIFLFSLFFAKQWNVRTNRKCIVITISMVKNFLKIFSTTSNQPVLTHWIYADQIRRNVRWFFFTVLLSFNSKHMHIYVWEKREERNQRTISNYRFRNHQLHQNAVFVEMEFWVMLFHNYYYVFIMLCVH